MSKNNQNQQKIVREYKTKLKHLSEVEIYSYADYLDGWLKFWGKNKDSGNYSKLWKYFKEIKEKGLKEDEHYKKLGDYGLFLLNYILYSFEEYEYPSTEKENEPSLLDCIISFHILMNYLKNEK